MRRAQGPASAARGVGDQGKDAPLKASGASGGRQSSQGRCRSVAGPESAEQGDLGPGDADLGNDPPVSRLERAKL